MKVVLNIAYPLPLKELVQKINNKKIYFYGFLLTTEIEDDLDRLMVSADTFRLTGDFVMSPLS